MGGKCDWLIVRLPCSKWGLCFPLSEDNTNEKGVYECPWHNPHSLHCRDSTSLAYFNTYQVFEFKFWQLLLNLHFWTSAPKAQCHLLGFQIFLGPSTCLTTASVLVHSRAGAKLGPNIQVVGHCVIFRFLICTKLRKFREQEGEICKDHAGRYYPRSAH